ncbi:MAG: hypothetical protein M3348_04440 [Acidobacteriota bacterium]|nr:hypothetical protein [Acidobacteriota bacterium]
MSQRVENEWNDARLSSRVRNIVLEAAAYAEQTYGWSFTLSSIYRTPAEDAALSASGIHIYWRAVDVRIKGRPQSQINDVADYINGRYVYDPARPNMKVCFKEPHGTGPHAHYQVHPNTKRR